MMKQFLRVKQIADQKFQRSEKSSVLTNELTAAEKRVDLIKESCCASGKKLSACMQRLTQESTDRRNSKKNVPEAALAQCMEEWGLSLGESSILGMTLVDFARVQDTLANDMLNYKTQVEDAVVEPLQTILNIDIDKILKFRKQLFKLTADLDTVKIRYHNALKNCQQGSGNGNSATKVQLLKEEAEDAASRVEQCRDSLTAEMFNLISREPEMSKLFVKLCQIQLEYHRKAFYMLESTLPELEAQIKCCPYQRVFGVQLEDHLRTSKREIATVIETCVCWLLESAMEEEGLFRIGGSMIKIKKMKSAFDAGLQHLIDEDRGDPHNIAGVLKLYLRSLPEPLLTYEFYEQWMDAALETDHDSRLRALWSVLNSLPDAYFKNLRYLIKFFAKLCQNSEMNKMSVQNVAIVIGPNLIWPQVDECALGMNMTATNLHSSIVDTLITYAEWFFPGDCEFYVCTPTSPRHIEGLAPISLSSSQLSLSTAKLSNGDSAVDSMSSSPTNSSPKSPSPRVPIRPRKKAAPKAPPSNSKNLITRSVSCGGFQANALTKANNIVQQSRFSQHSISHEDLINAGVIDSVFQDNTFNQLDALQEDLPDSQYADSQYTIVPRNKTPRTKPPRNSKNGLPPVVERTPKHIERPSVPPPERPDSYTKSASLSSEEVFEESDKIIELDDISISLNSSESDIYNDCQMSFMDDTDNEEDAAKSFKDCESPKHIETAKAKEKTVHFCEKVIDINKFQQTCSNTNENKASVKQTTTNAEVLNASRNTSDYSSENQSSNDESSFSKDYHSVGGTPTWFDHYGDDKRQSNTLWFTTAKQSEESHYDEITPIFETKKNIRNKKIPSPDEKYRTVIEVGNESTKSNTVSGTSIKLRVNSETQHTRL